MLTALVIGVGLVVAWWTFRNQQPGDTERRYRPIEVTQQSDYVSSESCRSCHGEQYDAWHASYHRTMTQLATPDAVLGDFDNVTALAYGRDIQLRRKGDEFWVSMFDPDLSLAKQTSRIERRIVLVTGSHHMQVYWYATGKDRRLAQLPVIWLKETSQWIPLLSAFIRPPGQRLGSAEGRWNQICIKCHTTHGQPRVDVAESVVDSQVAEFGIACEACHGPGRSHAVAHAAGAPLEARDAAMVQPADLTHQRSAEVCGQCHGVWMVRDETEAARLNSDGFSYRPGDELAATRHVFANQQPRSSHVEDFLKSAPHFLEDRFWSDGMVRVSGREFNGLARSPCYRKGELSCLSCHQLHQAEGDVRAKDEWANDQLAAEKLGDEACLQCHTKFRTEQELTAHTHHRVGSTGSQCYNCHMPYTTYGLLKAIRSHQITIPSAQESIRVGRPNACNQCHVDQTLPWTATWLEKWYHIQPPQQFTPEQQRYAATLLWCLTGDAGQRALATWTLGWSPAMKASRTDWIVPVLGQLLDDPYDPIRYIAHRSLRSQSGFESFDFQFMGSPDYRDQSSVRAYMQWRRTRTSFSGDDAPALLIGADGDLLHDQFNQLLGKRDDRPVVLNE